MRSSGNIDAVGFRRRVQCRSGSQQSAEPLLFTSVPYFSQRILAKGGDCCAPSECAASQGFDQCSLFALQQKRPFTRAVFALVPQRA